MPNLHENAFSQIRLPSTNEIEERLLRRRIWYLPIDHDAVGALLSGNARVLDPGRHELRPEDRVVLCRRYANPRLRFDTLRLDDRVLIELEIKVDLSTTDPLAFAARHMVGREALAVAELACLLQAEIKLTAQRQLQKYQAADLGDRVSAIQGEFAEPLQRWVGQNGLALQDIRIVECCVALDTQKARWELEQAMNAGEANQAAVLARLKADLDMRLGNLKNEAEKRETEHLLDAIGRSGRVAEKLAAVLQLLGGTHRPLPDESLQCQRCHQVAQQPEDLFVCRYCQRRVCQAHEVAGTGLCDQCHHEAELLKCPISGHFMKQADAVECQICGTVTCRECYDKEMRRCVKCAAEAAQKKASAPHALLRELREMPQTRDLRIWCDSERAATRGIGVVPRSDIREFTIGQRDIMFRLHADLDGYLRVFAVQSDGSGIPLYPNEHHSDYYLRGGKDFVFPDAQAAFRYRADPPPGVDTIVAVTCPQPFAIWEDDVLDARAGAPRPSSQRVKDPAAATAILEQVARKVQQGGWSSTQCQILVKDAHR